MRRVVRAAAVTHHRRAARTNAGEAVALIENAVQQRRLVGQDELGAERGQVSAVRWGVAGNILTAWVLTIPLSAAFAFLAMLGLKAVFGAH